MQLGRERAASGDVGNAGPEQHASFPGHCCSLQKHWLSSAWRNLALGGSVPLISECQLACWDRPQNEFFFSRIRWEGIQVSAQRGGNNNHDANNDNNTTSSSSYHLRSAGLTSISHSWSDLTSSPSPSLLTEGSRSLESFKDIAQGHTATEYPKGLPIQSS